MFKLVTNQLGFFGANLRALTLLCLVVSSPAWAQFQSQSVNISAFNNTNIGLARTNHMNDYGISAQLSGQSYFEQSTGSGIFFSSSLSATAYEVYTNLNRIEASAQFGYTKKLGIGFNQPRIAASLALSYRGSESQIRSGWSYSPTLSYSKNLSDRTSIDVSLQYYVFEASDRIDVTPGTAGWLDSRGNPASIKNSQFHLASEWALTPNTYLGLDASYLKGDFSSMALPTSGLSNFATSVSQDDVCGTDYYLYRYEGQGGLVGAELIHEFSSDKEIILRLQRSLVEADQGVNYGQSIINLSFSKRF